MPFFGPDHPGLVPWTNSLSNCTFAAPPSDDAPSLPTTTPLQEDMMALVEGDDDDDVLHSDVTLVGNDGVTVTANGAMIFARCPKLFDR